MELPAAIAKAIEPLFTALPHEKAMSRLVPNQGASAELIELVESITTTAPIADRPPLVAALWLYVDELDRSHVVSQGIEGATGSFWHGIMHRREGDFSNSHYWFNKVGVHPAMARMEAYDAHQFIDDVEAADGDQEHLVALQRHEWQMLFAWCTQAED